MSHNKMFVLTLVLALLLVMPTEALAQNEQFITVTPTATCDEVDFEVTVDWGTAPYSLTWEFGDGETQTVTATDITPSLPHTTSHAYSVSGDYEWALSIVDSSDPEMTGTASGTVTIGPTVTLSADIMPPFLNLDSGEVTVNFTAEVVNGPSSYTYAWNFEGASTSSSSPESNTASATYTTAGKFTASVTVTDMCGLTQTDTLLIVVFDPQTSCHPRAKQIADAVNSLFPDQAETLYTCVDIYEIFLGNLTGYQTGFGRLWHAYQLTSTIEDLTWEQIRDWHLDGTGWGLLVQLDRYADAIDEVGIADLIDRVLSGENTVAQIRTALRNAVRYEADFEDALSRLAGGASPGELGQFYRIAQELAVEPEVLDGYLELGISLAGIRHAGRLAGRYDADISAIVNAHTAGHSWGEIGQAYRLANEDTDAATILKVGVQEHRRELREAERADREAEHNLRKAAQIADRYDVGEEEVMTLYEGACNGVWSCVRAHFREQAREHDQSEKNLRTAIHLASQYDVSQEDVMGLFDGVCQGDWNCVRSYLRDQAREARNKDKD